MASASARPPPSTAAPSRNNFPYALAAAGHLLKSRSFTAGEGSPVTVMVPSTLPVGPVYGGSLSAPSIAATLALGSGVAFIGTVGAAAATELAVANPVDDVGG